MTLALTEKQIKILDGAEGRPGGLFGPLTKEIALGSLINEITERLDAIDGGTADHALKIDTIAEFTAAAGVTVDGVLLKDHRVQATGETTGTAGLTLTDNLASAWDVKEGTTSYLVFKTTNGAEAVQVAQRLTTTDGVASGIARTVGGVAGVNPAASTAITGTTETQTNFDNATLSIPANTLKVGTILRIKAWGRYTATTGAETHIFGVAFGAVNLCVTGNIDPATNDVWMLEFEIEVRSVGATGTVTGIGTCVSGPQATAAPATHLLATGSAGTSTTTVDTTATTTLGVFVDRQATATDSDSMRCDGFRCYIDG